MKKKCRRRTFSIILSTAVDYHVESSNGDDKLQTYSVCISGVQAAGAGFGEY
jgi:hypothetical protein